MAKAAESNKKIKVTLTAGLIGKKETQRKIVRALGLGKYGSSVVHADTPIIRGMCNKIPHLVTVTPADAAEGSKTKTKAKTTA